MVTGREHALAPEAVEDVKTAHHVDQACGERTLPFAVSGGDAEQPMEEGTDDQDQGGDPGEDDDREQR